jgi:hypothetical protein
MKAFKIICAVLLTMALTGWAGMFTGGGWIDGESGGKANFGFNANSYDYNPFTGDDVTGHFNHYDKMAGVKMNGTIVKFKKCPRYRDCDAPCDYWAEVEYRSTMPGDRGTGMAIMCAHDGGEGANTAEVDEVAMYVLSGPFEDYFNAGEVHGNLQSHECPEEDF